MLTSALARPLTFASGPSLIIDDAVIRVDPDGTARVQRPGGGHRRTTPPSTAAQAVQRQHAQVVATAREHRVPGPFLGVAHDSLGPGGDGPYWDGEILLAGYADFMRVGRFAYAPLPGGEAAFDHPARLALGYLYRLEDLGGHRGSTIPRRPCAWPSSRSPRRSRSGGSPRPRVDAGRGHPAMIAGVAR
ncbi:hypothetical protein AB0I28_37960 [Phytomonospora sp. NPDC050363]|uniref:Kae1-like domain-containing protein n=1 Tax=Phytomonospora sp. NPDC050363 TaxID=3155642 RepID=UPI0033E99A72